LQVFWNKIKEQRIILRPFIKVIKTTFFILFVETSKIKVTVNCHTELDSASLNLDPEINSGLQNRFNFRP